LLLIFLVVCIFVEVLVLVDTVFLGPSGHITGVHLSDKDMFLSNTRALERGGGGQFEREGSANEATTQ
jgi:hypothetical protein